MKKIPEYQKVKLITDKYENLGLYRGAQGVVFEKLSDEDFFVDFTTLKDVKTGKFRDDTEIVFKADDLEPIE